MRVVFSPGVALDAAASDVREAVSRVERQLPEAVEQLTVIKADADASPVMRLAASSETLSEEALTRIVEKDVIPALVSIDGVATVNLFGNRERMLRVVIDPLCLTSFGLSVGDIAAVLRQAPFDLPAGSFRSEDQELIVCAVLRPLVPGARSARSSFDRSASPSAHQEATNRAVLRGDGGRLRCGPAQDGRYSCASFHGGRLEDDAPDSPLCSSTGCACTICSRLPRTTTRRTRRPKPCCARPLPPTGCRRRSKSARVPCTAGALRIPTCTTKPRRSGQDAPRSALLEGDGYEIGVGGKPFRLRALARTVYGPAGFVRLGGRGESAARGWNRLAPPAR